MLTFIFVMLIVCFVYFMYLATILAKFHCGVYSTKKELLLDLIPFRDWVKSFIKDWNKLK